MNLFGVSVFLYIFFGVALGPKVMPLGPGKYLPNVVVFFCFQGRGCLPCEGREQLVVLGISSSLN